MYFCAKRLERFRILLVSLQYKLFITILRAGFMNSLMNVVSFDITR